MVGQLLDYMHAPTAPKPSEPKGMPGYSPIKSRPKPVDLLTF